VHGPAPPHYIVFVFRVQPRSSDNKFSQAVLNPDNDARKAAEFNLQAAAASHPDSFMSSLLGVSSYALRFYFPYSLFQVMTSHAEFR